MFFGSVFENSPSSFILRGENNIPPKTYASELPLSTASRSFSSTTAGSTILPTPVHTLNPRKSHIPPEYLKIFRPSSQPKTESESKTTRITPLQDSRHQLLDRRVQKQSFRGRGTPQFRGRCFWACLSGCSTRNQ